MATLKNAPFSVIFKQVVQKSWMRLFEEFLNTVPVSLSICKHRKKKYVVIIVDGWWCSSRSFLCRNTMTWIFGMIWSISLLISPILSTFCYITLEPMWIPEYSLKESKLAEKFQDSEILWCKSCMIINFR